MNNNSLSYWEYKSWFYNIDYLVIGSGIVGLHCALQLKKQHPNSNITVIERGSLPQGASTKNAGFACFGSISEIAEDLKTLTALQVSQLINIRWQGLQLLLKNLGKKNIDFQKNGGFELFLKDNTLLLEQSLENLQEVNEITKEAIKTTKPVFIVKKTATNFKKVENKTIFNSFEAQIDTGKMMMQLLYSCYKKGIRIINNIKIEKIEDLQDKVAVNTSLNTTFYVKKVFVATNGFAKLLLPNLPVHPARAQVLITSPIKNLKVKGTFHINKGYDYFRNIDQRILIGGGRNLDFMAEQTTKMETSINIQNYLEQLLKEVILPQENFTITHRWSGIMGVGESKIPIVKATSKNVFCGVRLGGMGIAIGSIIGTQLAQLNLEND